MNGLGSAAAWPSLEGTGSLETVGSLRLWAQIVGKTRLALSPMVNHWWQVAFYVTARGLGTSPIAVDDRVFDVEVDFVGHELVVRTSDGGIERMPLRDGTLAHFYAEYAGCLARLGIDALDPSVRGRDARADPPRSRRRGSAGYDPDWANRFFRVLLQADRLLKEFRGRFIGKASPVHFFWGGFDLAVTRFSGRPATPHPGGIPNVGDWVMREAYSHEVSSAGFWPGDERFPHAAFYAYAYPEPAGFKDAKIRPGSAGYEPSLGEFVLPYEAVRTAADPSGEVLAFLESTYEPAATLARWDRHALERQGDLDRLG